MECQGIGIRAAAVVVDSIVFFFVFFLLGRAMFGAWTWSVFGLAAVQFISIFAVIFFLYYIILEGVLGATIGKLVCKIKVVRENGKPCGMGPSIMRNVLRIIDGIFFYLVGAILIARSAKCQRLGDRIAHTIVIKSK